MHKTEIVIPMVFWDYLTTPVEYNGYECVHWWIPLTYVTSWGALDTLQS